MQQITNGNVFILRLDRGEKINSSLLSFFKEKNILSSAFSAIGACENIELGYYDLEKKEYIWKIFSEKYEIISLTGNLASFNNEAILHMHGVFSNNQYQTIGGHVRDFIISATCEIEIKILEGNLNRSFDENTGLKLLCEEGS